MTETIKPVPEESAENGNASWGEKASDLYHRHFAEKCNNFIAAILHGGKPLALRNIEEVEAAVPEEARELLIELSSDKEHLSRLERRIVRGMGDYGINSKEGIARFGEIEKRMMSSPDSITEDDFNFFRDFLKKVEQLFDEIASEGEFDIKDLLG